MEEIARHPGSSPGARSKVGQRALRNPEGSVQSESPGRAFLRQGLELGVVDNARRPVPDRRPLFGLGSGLSCTRVAIELEGRHPHQGSLFSQTLPSSAGGNLVTTSRPVRSPSPADAVRAGAGCYVRRDGRDNTGPQGLPTRSSMAAGLYAPTVLQPVSTDAPAPRPAQKRVSRPSSRPCEPAFTLGRAWRHRRRRVSDCRPTSPKGNGGCPDGQRRRRRRRPQGQVPRQAGPGARQLRGGQGRRRHPRLQDSAPTRRRTRTASRTRTAARPTTTRDGVLDKDDKCPNEPETKNGYQDDDGCPDEVPVTVKKFTGVVKGINFRRNSADIKASSFPLLKEAVKVFREYPDLRVEISGHTSTEGKRDFNMKLSRKRAESVKGFLTSAGRGELDQHRGYGPTSDRRQRHPRKEKNRRRVPAAGERREGGGAAAPPAATGLGRGGDSAAPAPRGKKAKKERRRARGGADAPANASPAAKGEARRSRQEATEEADKKGEERRHARKASTRRASKERREVATEKKTDKK